MERLFASIRQHASLLPVPFDSLQGWHGGNQRQALDVLAATCAGLLQNVPPLRPGLAPPQKLIDLWADVVSFKKSDPSKSARDLFENLFQPYLVVPNQRRYENGNGFLTGYYEPVVSGSPSPSGEYSEPILALPDDHIRFDTDAPRPSSLNGLSTALCGPNGIIRPYPDRAEIENGCLGSREAPLLWVRDGIEAYMIHVQGSARIRLPGNQIVRLKYAGRNGHPYTSIGRILVDSGEIEPELMSLERLKTWVRRAGQQRGAPGRALMQKNQSFIFFKIDRRENSNAGPIGAANMPLTPLVSIAIDRTVWPYGLPYWIDSRLPWRSAHADTFRRLMIGQDTGSAIIGPSRADIFFGSGKDAGTHAGNVRHECNFYVLLPK